MATTNKIRKNFTIMPNEILLDNSLHSQAKIIYWYMSSKPDDWDFYLEGMSTELNISKDLIRKYMKQLIDSGWVTSQGQSLNDGKFGNVDYTLNQYPELVGEEGSSPYSDFPDTVKNRHGENRMRKTTTHTNTIRESNTIREENNTIIHIENDENNFWKQDLATYQTLVDEAATKLSADNEHKTKYVDWFPNIDYDKTISKTADWWRSEDGWNYSKKRKSATIDLKSTLKRNLDKNKVFKPFESKFSSQKSIESIDEKLKLFRVAQNR